MVWSRIDQLIYRWRAASTDVRWTVRILALIAAGTGGWFFATDIAAHGQSPVADTFVVLTTTVRDTQTIVRRGKTVTRVVPRVKRIAAKRSVVFETVTTTTQGRVVVVTRPVVHLVPVVRQRVVTTAGKTRTVSEFVTVTTSRTQTQVVTSERTVVNTQVATETQTVSRQTTVDRPVTVTGPSPPPETVVQTQPVTVTHESTVTQPVTVTHESTVTQPVTVVTTVTTTATVTVTAPTGP